MQDESLSRSDRWHVLVHDYLGIDLAEVWAVVERGLPTLKKQVSRILKHSITRLSKE